MKRTILTSVVAVAMTATGVVAALTSFGKTNDTFTGDIPAITVYADRNDVTLATDMPTILVEADRHAAPNANVEVSYGERTGDLPDITVTASRTSDGVNLAGNPAGTLTF